MALNYTESAISTHSFSTRSLARSIADWLNSAFDSFHRHRKAAKCLQSNTFSIQSLVIFLSRLIGWSYSLNFRQAWERKRILNSHSCTHTQVTIIQTNFRDCPKRDARKVKIVVLFLYLLAIVAAAWTAGTDRFKNGSKWRLLPAKKTIHQNVNKHRHDTAQQRTNIHRSFALTHVHSQMHHKPKRNEMKRLINNNAIATCNVELKLYDGLASLACSPSNTCLWHTYIFKPLLVRCSWNYIFLPTSSSSIFLLLFVH